MPERPEIHAVGSNAGAHAVELFDHRDGRWTVVRQAIGTVDGGTFHFLGGTITGAPQFKNATIILDAEPTGPSSIVLVDNSTLTTDSIYASQTVTIRNTSIVAKGLTSANGFTNNGNISLTADSSGSPVLTVTNGALTNSATGTLTFPTVSNPSAIPRFVGDLINNGSVSVAGNTWFYKSNGQYTNNGTFSIASGKTLAIFGGTFEQAAGTFSIATTGVAKFDGTGVMNLTGGTLSVSGTLDLTDSKLNILGGTLANGFDARNGSVVNISGGTIGSDFDALGLSTVNVFGTQFVLGGSDITASLEPHVPTTITQRNVVLSGQLTDGSVFDFELNSSDSSGHDFFSSAATLTVTLGVPGDFNNDGEVDSADYISWRVDPNRTQAGYNAWRAFFGHSTGSSAGGDSGSATASSSLVEVPEPASLWLGLLSAALLWAKRWAR